MTCREIYDAVLVELNKANASEFSLDEFNYVLNNVIMAFVNDRYKVYDRDMQASDDLRVLTKTAKFNVKLKKEDGSYRLDPTYNKISGAMFSTANSGTNTIEVSAVSDIKPGSKIKFGTEDNANIYTVSAVNVSDYPYIVTLGSNLLTTIEVGTPIFIETAYVEQVSADTFTDYKVALTLPSSDYQHLTGCRTVWVGKKPGQSAGESARIVYPAKRLTQDIQNVIQNNVYARPSIHCPYFLVKDNANNAGIAKLDLSVYRAYQNRPTIDVFTGRKRSNIQLDFVTITYIKMPERVIMDDIDIFTAGADNSQVLELPDYLKPHIIKMVTDRLLEISSDPRLNTHIQMDSGIPAAMQPQQPTNTNSQK